MDKFSKIFCTIFRIYFFYFFAGRPLAWLICLYHLVEILFRAIFVAIDGLSSGPDTYSGEIGQVISDKDTTWKTKDKKIRFKKKRPGLVKDMKYGSMDNHDDNVLIQKALLIQHGPDSQYKDAVHLTPGLLNLARWKNTDANALDLFIISEKPSKDLLEVVDFSLNVYIPAIQRIQKKPHFSDGPRNYFFIIELARNHFKNNKKLYENNTGDMTTLYDEAKKVFTNNWYWGSYEHILMARMVDKDKDVRKLAIQEYEENEKHRNELLKRNSNAQPRKLQFIKEAFNYDNAQSYIELFDTSKLVDKNGRGKPRLKTNFPLCSLFTLDEWKKSIQLSSQVSVYYM